MSTANLYIQTLQRCHGVPPLSTFVFLQSERIYLPSTTPLCDPFAEPKRGRLISVQMSRECCDLISVLGERWVILGSPGFGHVMSGILDVARWQQSHSGRPPSFGKVEGFLHSMFLPQSWTSTHLLYIEEWHDRL